MSDPEGPNFELTDQQVESRFGELTLRQAIRDEDIWTYARNLEGALTRVKAKTSRQMTHVGCKDRREAFVRDYVQSYYGLSDRDMLHVLFFRGDIDELPADARGGYGEA